MALRKEIITNLNNLSSTNFEIIIAKIHTILESTDNYQLFLEIFFNKTINNSEILFINLYTKLISELLKHILKNNKENFLVFYRLLINNCQNILTQPITDENYKKIENSALLISTFINHNIIKRELISNIIDILIIDNNPNKINVLVKLLSNLDIKSLNKADVEKINYVKNKYNQNSRIYILLDDINEKI